MTEGAPDIQTNQHPAGRDDVVVHELDGEAVLYDERSGAVHRFNVTALTVWKACDGSRSIPDISSNLADRYTLGSDEARTEVENVIRDLESKGLLTEQADPPIHPASRLPSRRELLCGGTAKLIYTAPLISTFFATGACASGPSASGAFGANCKTVGYSCANPPECCEFPGDGLCLDNACCGFVGVACDSDADCCTPRTCVAGSCSA